MNRQDIKSVKKGTPRQEIVSRFGAPDLETGIFCPGGTSLGYRIPASMKEAPNRGQESMIWLDFRGNDKSDQAISAEEYLQAVWEDDPDHLAL